MTFNDMVKRQRSGIKKGMSDYLDDMTDEERRKADFICDLCQCNAPFFERRNEELLMLMSYYDSDCEFYFNDLNIEQEDTYNIVNLSKISIDFLKERYNAQWL